MYDYVIVGAGFFGATFARMAADCGKKCLIIDKRNHIGGNAYSERKSGIDVHMYGPHIFHTNNKPIWDFVNRFSSFNNFILTPKVIRNGKIYSLPFNMNTFYQVWGCYDPKEAKKIIESQKFQGIPTNLEEQALSLVGKDIYELIIKDYTKKQWMKDPKDLPSFIIKRLPLRFEYNDNYFDDQYQGIPINGYECLFKNMLEGIETRLGVDYFEDRNYWHSISKCLIFTGKIDEYFNYEFGELEYRTLDFHHEELDIENFQGVAQMNYPSLDVPYTRIIEHKHFTKVKTSFTIITKEIPALWSRDKIPYYPLNDNKNNEIYNLYKEKSENIKNVLFGGRLSEYKYYDMHQVIASAMKLAKIHLGIGTV